MNILKSLYAELYKKNERERERDGWKQNCETNQSERYNLRSKKKCLMEAALMVISSRLNTPDFLRKKRKEMADNGKRKKGSLQSREDLLHAQFFLLRNLFSFVGLLNCMISFKVE